MISDNYLSAAVVSYQKKDCGSHFVSYFSHGILSIPTSSRGGCGRDGLPFPLYVFSCLLPGAPFALHTTPPHLCWCLTVCFHTPLWGLGDGTFRYSRTFKGGSLWFAVVTHTNFPMWFFVVTTPASSSVTKIPATSTSRLRAPCPAGSATTTSTFQTLQLLWRAVHLSCDSRWVVGRFSG